MLSRSSASNDSGPWKIPGMPVTLFLLLLAWLLAYPNPLLIDLDVGWLVRTGELIWQKAHLPQEDVFSFTQAGRTWLLYQWGAELYLGGFHLLAGLGGVIWGSAIFIALTYSLLLYAALRLGVPRVWAIGLVALAIWATKFYWLARPASASFLFYLVVLLILESYRREPGRQLWGLPPLFLLWANFHLAFITGLGVVFLYGVVAWLAPDSFRGGAARDRGVLLILPLCVAVTFINPYGYHLLPYIWSHATQPFVIGAQLTEVKSPDFHNPLYWAFLAQIALLFWLGGPGFPGRGLFLTMLTATLAMALYSLRHIPFFAITATLYLAHLVKLRQGESRILSPAQARQGWGWACVGLVISLIWVAGVESRSPGFYRFDAEVVPQGAANFLAQEAVKCRPLHVFSEDAQWVDYFIYRLYPKVKVFIDTRFDFYGNEFFQKYMTIKEEVLCHPQSLNPWQVDYLIINKKFLLKCSSPHPSWLLVYEDRQALIYCPKRLWP